MPKRPNKIEIRSYSFDLPCENKRRFKTEAEAVDAAEFRMLENMTVDLSVYQCNVCRYWHITRTKPKTKK